MPDNTPNPAEPDPKPKNDGTPATEQEDLEEAQKNAAEEREEEGGYQ